MFNAYFDETSRRLFGMTGTADGDPREGRKWVVENFDPVSSVRYMRDGRLRPGSGSGRSRALRKRRDSQPTTSRRSSR